MIYAVSPGIYSPSHHFATGVLGRRLCLLRLGVDCTRLCPSHFLLQPLILLFLTPQSLVEIVDRLLCLCFLGCFQFLYLVLLFLGGLFQSVYFVLQLNDIFVLVASLLFRDLFLFLQLRF